MLDDAIALLLTRLLEPGGEERGLRALGVVGQQVQVAEAAQARTRVVERELGPLCITSGPSQTSRTRAEQRDHREVADRGRRLMRRQRADVQAVRAAAPRLEQLDAMEPQGLLVRRLPRAGCRSGPTCQ